MRSGLKATGHSHNTKEHEKLSLQLVGVAKQPCKKDAFRNLPTFFDGCRLQLIGFKLPPRRRRSSLTEL